MIEPDLKKFPNVTRNDISKRAVLVKKGFICDICPASYRTKWEMRGHMENTHLNEAIKQYPDSRKCKFCTKFIFKEDYKDHLRQKHKPIRCGICEKLYFNAVSLRVHSKTHGALKYSCDICKGEFTKKEVLKRHIVTVHLRQVPRSECELCGKVLATSALRAHMNQVHKAIRGYRCAVCKKKFYNLQHLRLHLATVHLKQRNFTCSICDRKFSRSGALVRHLNTVHEVERKYKCEKCQRTFTQITSLQRHVKIHEKQPFSCQKCIRMFKSKMALKQHHAKIHIKPRVLHTCDTCDKKFKSQSNLKIHITTQHLKYKYQCDVCGNEYTSKSYLKHHLFEHHFEKP